MLRSVRFSTWLAGLGLLLIAGCARQPVRAPYPHESILTVIAELKIFLEQDPWRRPAGTDLQGRNIYRVSLERLEALKQLTGPEYADVLAFARGEALERLADYDAARLAFEEAAATSTTLAPIAARRAGQAGRLIALVDRSRMGASLEAYLNDLEVLDRDLAAWQAENPDWPYGPLIRLERERALEERVRLLFTNRLVLPDAVPRALELAGRLVEANGPSDRAPQHWLLVGELHETLAREVTARLRPEESGFRAEAGWNELVEQARAAYRRVAQADGHPAKPEGQARLRALDAYALRVQNAAQ